MAEIDVRATKQMISWARTNEDLDRLSLHTRNDGHVTAAEKNEIAAWGKLKRTSLGGRTDERTTS